MAGISYIRSENIYECILLTLNNPSASQWRDKVNALHHIEVTNNELQGKVKFTA
jgi:hypothetical protein